eukprot:1152579-Pelagomonas_calceolata.AAC.13
MPKPIKYKKVTEAIPQNDCTAQTTPGGRAAHSSAAVMASATSTSGSSSRSLKRCAKSRAMPDLPAHSNKHVGKQTSPYSGTHCAPRIGRQHATVALLHWV